MKVHVERSERMRPGGARWSIMGDDELLLYVSARGVTRVGAAALQRAYTTYLDRGEWRFQQPGGMDITAAYQVGPLPKHVPVRFAAKRGHYTVTLSDLHFTEASCQGIARCVQESIAMGWRYHQVVWIVRQAS